MRKRAQKCKVYVRTLFDFLLRPHTIFCKRIGTQIVPLLIHPVAAFARYPCFPPAKRMFHYLSCGQGQPGKEAVDPDSLLDMLQEQELSVCPSASSLIITKGFPGVYNLMESIWP